jgi:ketosteroid isomerase-like protein
MRPERCHDFVDRYFAARLKNDPAAVTPLFAPQARYVMVGAPGESPVVSTDLGAASFSDIAAGLAAAWRWRSVEIRALVAEGDKAAAHFGLVVDYTPTGERVNTELANFWTFRDGLCVELIEFVDTALVRRMTS